MPRSILLHLLLLPGLCGTLTGRGDAQPEDILWGSSFHQDNRDSSNSPLDGSFSFYLGVFDPPVPNPGEDPWVPSPANTSDWATHWITADVTIYDPINSRFSAGYTTEPFVEGVSLTGKQGYIWGVNRACPNGEWILLTNPAWIWPMPGGLGFPESWTASDGTAVIGQVDQDGIHLQTAPVTNAPPPLLKPELWRRAHFTQEELDTQEAAVSGWFADPNENGHPNILEYAFGTAPRAPHLDKAPAHELIELTGTRYQVIRATIDPNIDLTISAEVSSDLVNWFEDVSLHTATETELVFRDLTPLSASHPARFIRLRAELPSGGPSPD